MFDNCQIGDPLGVGPGISWSPPGSAVIAANPNLLLWTDELDNPVWVKTACVITPNGDGVADDWASTGVTSAVRQTTTTAAASGAAVTSTMAPGQLGAYVHGEVAGVFGGTTYTFSLMAKDTGAALSPSITMRIDLSGGFLRCSTEDPVGDGDYLVKSFQLQVGPFTSYQHRGGS